MAQWPELLSVREEQSPLLPLDTAIDKFQCVKLQLNIIDLSMRLWGINPTNSVVLSMSLELRSIVLC